MDQLIDLLRLKEKEVLSIVGMRGKTSLIKLIASQAKDDVLISTTTKIDYPDYNVNNLSLFKRKPGLNFYGDYIKRINKYGMNNLDVLNNLSKEYPLTLIEADGSRNKPLKAYKDDPIIIGETTLTIICTSLEAFKSRINDTNVLRLELFLNQTKSDDNEYLSNEGFKLMLNEITSKAKGRICLCFNRIVTKEEEKELKEIIKINNNFKDLNITMIIYGDIKTNHWRLYNE